MLWSVKAVFFNREAGIQGVAQACHDNAIALQDLRSTTGRRGQVVDEIVLASSDGWTSRRIGDLMAAAGAATVQVIAVDADHPEAHLNAERKARLAHPGGTRRNWHGMRAAG
ncbi:hypothetical protein [Nocardioides yefusunii]|uniref:Uncharacterized protein n=1 Tax=Nocardioides yefusunii TaxID=2500546 RepID=A0ABW1QZY1_9ACTN|nr:hypothetical protein [Nocardioides yefusunii]